MSFSLSSSKSPSKSSSNPLAEPEPPAFDKILRNANQICEKNGVRLTTLRRQILVLLLQQHGKPLGAYALMDLLAASSDREQVAPPTVYRTLDFLLEHRLIHKIHSRNAFVVNTNPGRSDSSVILICGHCCNAEEVPSNSIQQAINLSASQHRFSVEKQVIEITGSCQACRRNAAAAHQ